MTTWTFTAVVLLRAAKNSTLVEELWSRLRTWTSTGLFPTAEKMRPKSAIRMIGKISEKNSATGFRR